MFNNVKFHWSLGIAEECVHNNLFKLLICSGVLAVETYDITADGVPDLLVGRDDGLIEIYGFDEMEEPVHRYKQVWIPCEDCLGLNLLFVNIFE